MTGFIRIFKKLNFTPKLSVLVSLKVKLPNMTDWHNFSELLVFGSCSNFLALQVLAMFEFPRTSSVGLLFALPWSSSVGHLFELPRTSSFGMMLFEFLRTSSFGQLFQIPGLQVLGCCLYFSSFPV